MGTGPKGTAGTYLESTFHSTPPTGIRMKDSHTAQSRSPTTQFSGRRPPQVTLLSQCANRSRKETKPARSALRPARTQMRNAKRRASRRPQHLLALTQARAQVEAWQVKARELQPAKLRPRAEKNIRSCHPRLPRHPNDSATQNKLARKAPSSAALANFEERPKRITERAVGRTLEVNRVTSPTPRRRRERETLIPGTFTARWSVRRKLFLQRGSKIVLQAALPDARAFRPATGFLSVSLVVTFPFFSAWDSRLLAPSAASIALSLVCWRYVFQSPPGALA